MKPLKIYLADLTYDTITISTEAMPLNIGFIASYSLEKFKNDVNITLFKYINKLEKAIRESPPDVLGLSNYIWSHNIASEIFKIFRFEYGRFKITYKPSTLHLIIPKFLH